MVHTRKEKGRPELSRPSPRNFRIGRARAFVPFVVMLITLTALQPSSAQATRWNITILDLGLLPGDDFSFARDINNAGQIVGTSYGDSGASSRAFIWENGTMKDLETLPGG